MTADPFEALADSGDAYARPDEQFATRLRRRVERELIEQRNDPVVALTDRTPLNHEEPVMADNNNPDITSPDDAVRDRGTQILTPYISVHDGAAALDWYRDALGAEETVRYVGDDGRLGHAEFVLAGARVMLSDAYPEIGVVAATSYEGSSCALHVEVADCDALHDRAVEQGATSSMPPTDQPHGARSATIIDPFGHRWMLSQQMSSPTTAEIDAAYDGFTVTEPE